MEFANTQSAISSGNNQTFFQCCTQFSIEQRRRGNPTRTFIWTRMKVNTGSYDVRGNHAIQYCFRWRINLLVTSQYEALAHEIGNFATPDWELNWNPVHALERFTSVQLCDPTDCAVREVSLMTLLSVFFVATLATLARVCLVHLTMAEK